MHSCTVTAKVVKAMWFLHNVLVMGCSCASSLFQPIQPLPGSGFSSFSIIARPVSSASCFNHPRLIVSEKAQSAHPVQGIALVAPLLVPLDPNGFFSPTRTACSFITSGHEEGTFIKIKSSSKKRYNYYVRFRGRHISLHLAPGSVQQ